MQRSSFLRTTRETHPRQRKYAAPEELISTRVHFAASALLASLLQLPRGDDNDCPTRRDDAGGRDLFIPNLKQGSVWLPAPSLAEDAKMAGTKRSLVVAVGVLLVIALGLSALTGSMMGPGMMDPGAMPGGGWMWGLGMGLGGLTMLIFWGALIVGIVLFARFLGAKDVTSSERTSLDVVKRRYAAGEITREQYEEIRKTLDEG